MPCGRRGEIAERKARLLIDAGAQLTVVALSFTPQFLSWQQAQKIRLIQRAFTDELINHQWLVIAATNNDAVNQQVYQAANARQTFCNVVDSPQQASFIMPSIIDRSPIMVAISSGAKPLFWRASYAKSSKSAYRSIWGA